MQGDLTLKEHITEVNDLGNIGDFKCLAEDPVPDSVHFTDLTDFASPGS